MCKTNNLYTFYTQPCVKKVICTLSCEKHMYMRQRYPFPPAKNVMYECIILHMIMCKHVQTTFFLHMIMCEKCANKLF